MPIKKLTTSTSPSYLPTGDLQTIWPALFRKSTTNYRRERIDTPDGDFLDLDWIKTGANKLVIISHGLEGSSDGQYVKGMAAYLAKKGLDVLAWNYRGRGGEPNNKLFSYHAGFTDDLKLVVNRSSLAYEKIALVGFSIGGIISLNYLGRCATYLPRQLKAAVCFSTALHLHESCLKLDRPRNWLFRKYFLKKLRKTIEEKEVLYPNEIQLDKFKQVRTVNDFDELYTAPVNGFASAEDYHDKSSPIEQLHKIEKDVLIVNAQNDTLIGDGSCPDDIPNLPANVHLEIYADGGHVGFSKTDENGDYWSDRRCYRFLEEVGFC